MVGWRGRLGVYEGSAVGDIGGGCVAVRHRRGCFGSSRIGIFGDLETFCRRRRRSCNGSDGVRNSICKRSCNVVLLVRKWFWKSHG